MVVLYMGTADCSDSDFPLIRALQQKGVEIYSYFYVNRFHQRTGLINIKLKITNSIIPADQYEDLNVYNKYLDLSKVFIINHYYVSRRELHYWLYGSVWKKVYRHMKKYKAQIIHYTWPIDEKQTILYKLNCKIVQTIHDPFPHSGQFNILDENNRLEAIRRADKLVLLSTPLLDKFCEYYNINKNKILLNKMGEFDYLNLFRYKVSNNNRIPYILYIGQIQEHKGIDYLMEAMVKTHQRHPKVKLIIAGKGVFPFDITSYSNLEYIEIRNYYIEVKEMVELLVNSIFAVCPYKDATQSGVVLTAFSVGTPLVVTNVGDLPLSVIDDVTGKVVPPCDVEALSATMNLLLEDKNLLNKYKENINNIWKKNQQWSPIAQKYIDTYKYLTKQ